MYFEDFMRKRFTGFNVKWEFCCNGNDTADNWIQDNVYNYNKLFMQIANVIHASNSSKTDIMQLVRSTKVKHKDKLHAFDDRTIANDSFKNALNSIGHKMNMTQYMISDPLYVDEISDQSLEIAAEILIYIMAPPDQNWLNWHRVYEEWMLQVQNSLRRLIGKY